MGTEGRMKATQVEGRTISLGLQITLTPPKTDKLGETEAAIVVGRDLLYQATGRGIIHEAMLLLKSAAEAEGFTVVVSQTNRVF